MKNITEMTTEELLKAVGPTADLKTPEKKSPLLEFIQENDLAAGKITVPNYAIFYFYMTMWRPSSKVKLSKIAFFREFNKHFTSTRTKSTRQYMLSTGISNNQRDFNEEAKENNKRYDRKRTKKAQQKRDGKVPSTV